MLWMALQRLARPPIRNGILRCDLCFCIILAIVVWFAYEPSLKHPPRSDQWCFLVDTMQHHDFIDILEHSYSYNRTRTVMPGDTDLFRPILFALLAAEKAAFEGNLAAYQTVGIVLHCIVCVLLLFLLRSIDALSVSRMAEQSGQASAPRYRPANLLPYGIVAFFALNPAIQELVIWHHVGGYLLFLVFVLGSMLFLLRWAGAESDQHWLRPSLWGAWLLALLAAFTHELGQVYAVLAGLFLATAAYPISGGKRAFSLFALFASIVLLYQGVNAIDRRVHKDQFAPDGHRELISERAFTALTPTHTARFVAYTTVQPFFPSMLARGYGGGRWRVGELLYDPANWNTGIEKSGWTDVVSLVVFGLLIGAVSFGMFRLIKSRRRILITLFLLFAGLYAAYVGITVLGRMNVRLVPEVLTINSYYAYFGLLFALLAGYTACQAIGGGSPLISRVVPLVLLAGLITLAASGAMQVWQANQIVTHSLRDYSTPIRTLHKFVEKHRHEPDFSLAIDYESSDPIPIMHDLHITDVVFARWTSAEPKYRVAIRDRNVHILPVAAPAERSSILSGESPDAKILLSTRRGG